MKKINILALLFLVSFSCLHSSNDINSLNLKKLNIEKMSYEQKISVFERVKNGLDYTADSIESMMTKKGMVKAFIVFVIYCYLFPPEPITDCIGDIFSFGIDKTAGVFSGVASKILDKNDNVNVLIESIGELQGRYDIVKEAGRVDALWNTILETPLTGLSLMAEKVSSKVWDAGIPFISVIFANKLFNVQR